MPSGVPGRSQAQGGSAAGAAQVMAAAPEAEAAARAARERGAGRRPGGLRPSRVPALTDAAGAGRAPRPGDLAVQRAVRLRPSGARVQAAVPPSAVPAQPVRDMLRAPGQPLAEPVRQDMEARLSADFSDVRVHRDAAGHQAARSVGARAFTTGSHIAFARSQYDPASAAGRQTLAHELAHVIQQRSGPVAGTPAGDGLRVSDPADGHERAARATAQRALADGRRSAGPPARAAGQPAVPAGGAIAVQRAVGFEFEVHEDSSSVHTLTPIPGGKESRKKTTDTKAALKYLDADGKLVNSTELSYVSADSGRVEYVTRPLYARDDVESAIDSIVKFHGASSTSGGRHNERITGLDGRQYAVSVVPGSPAKAQASLGVGLEDITTLFEELRTLSERQDAESQPKRRRRDEISQEDLNIRVGLLASANTAEAERFAGLVDNELPPPTTSIQNEKSIGFLAIIFKIALDADARKGRTLDDAKYAFDLMPRSDFVSVFRSMNARTQKRLRDNLIFAIELVPELGDAWLDANVFGRYKADIPQPLLGNSKVYEGPTRRAWIQSIITGAPGAKDLLSPPPGYQPHAPGRRNEGIGAMGTDSGLAVFELRGIGQAFNEQRVAMSDWKRLALTVTDLAARVTDDRDLAEP